MKKILLFNGFILFLLITLTELILGDWRNNYFTIIHQKAIPNLIKDRKITYNAKNILGTENDEIIIYTRDKDGYRSKSSQIGKKIILTIGGSTTDQRYITDGETWQDYLDILIPKYDFVNGGVDGQSTFGHIVSLKNWHINALNSEDVHGVFYYLGGNDGRLLYEDFNRFEITESKLGFLNSILNNNSFFYKRIKKIRGEIKYHYSYNSGDFTLARHKKREIDFLPKNQGRNFSVKTENNYPYYEDLFNNLLIDTLKAFPKAKIYIFQQQLPGCIFYSLSQGIDLHPYSEKDDLDGKNKICEELASVFIAQNKVSKENNFSNKVFLIPMYLESILQKNDVYDYSHTNKLGGKKIADYIYETNLIK